MTGLAHYERDRQLAARGALGNLVLPSDAELLAHAEAPLRELLRGDVPARLELQHARWKPGVSVQALWRVLGQSGAESFLTWKRYATDKALHLAERFAGDDEQRWLLGDASAPDHAWLLGPRADRELPGLEALLGEQGMRRIARHLRDAGTLGNQAMRRRASHVEVLRYKPERRAVAKLEVQLRGAGPKTMQLGMRVLEPSLCCGLATLRAELAKQAGAASMQPRVVFHDERFGWLCEAWLDGAVDESRALASGRAVGDLLRQLHNLPVPAAVAEQSARGTMPDAVRGARELFALDEPLLSLFDSVTETLAAHAAPSPESTWCHGDLHPDQVLFGADGALRLLDLDALHVGRREHDLATWIADQMIVGTERDWKTAASELCAGYGITPDRALARAVAEQLIHQAAGALRRLQVDAVHLASERLALALETLEQ